MSRKRGRRTEDPVEAAQVAAFLGWLSDDPEGNAHRVLSLIDGVDRVLELALYTRNHTQCANAVRVARGKIARFGEEIAARGAKDSEGEQIR